jgi:hypothetical protein
MVWHFGARRFEILSRDYFDLLYFDNSDWGNPLTVLHQFLKEANTQKARD